MYKIIVTDYEGEEIDVIVSAEVFEIFEDNRKQDLREQNEMRRHRDYRGLQNYYVLQELASPTNDLEIRAFNKLLLHQVFKVVKTCSPLQQERFYLYYICGYTMKEIGFFQNCTKSAVSSSLKMVDRKIKKELLLKVDGVLSEERFKKLSYKYEGEQAEVSVQLKEQQKIVDCEKGHELNVNSFLKMVRKYTQIHELNLHILNHFIKEIVVYHREELKESKTQRIDIHFNFIGEVSLPTIEERRKYKKSFARTKKEDQIALAI